MNLSHVHLWAPQIGNFRGGIQAFSGFFRRALQNSLPLGTVRTIMKHEGSMWRGGDLRGCEHVPEAIRTPAFAAYLAGSAIVERPDLIVATHIHFAPVAALLRSLLGIPYWLVAHGVEAWDIPSPLVRLGVRNADRILAVSSYTAERLRSLKLASPSHISVFPNTFNEDRFMPGSKPQYLLKRYGFSELTKVILTVTRMDSRERYKGYDRVIESLPEIAAAVPDAHFLIVGSGDDRERAERRAYSLGVSHRVTFAGFVPDSELCDHYNLCDLFAMPSVGEGFGIVFLEALACGRPVLGGNRDGTVDALAHGEFGVLIDPDDKLIRAQSIINILLRRVEHPLLYDSSALSTLVRSRFGYESFLRNVSRELSTP